MNFTNDYVRRQDRLLDETAACGLLHKGEYGFLSMVREDGGAYGIPLNFVWDGGDSIYLHCAPEGEKLGCISRNPAVSFCVVGPTEVVSDKFTTAYESVILKCRAQTGLAPDERLHALELLLKKYSPDDTVVGMKYAEKSFHRTEIIRLDIKSCSGKCKKIQK